MNPYEIAETLINGNISDARRAIVGDGLTKQTKRRVALLTLAVADELGKMTNGATHQLRRCLEGDT